MRDDLKLSALRQEHVRLTREVAAANAKITDLKEDNNRMHALCERLSDLLKDTANAIKGEPDPRMMHSWHDLPEWAAAARAVAVQYLAASAPGATIAEAAAFIRAMQAWRDLSGRDLFETELAFAEFDAARNAS